MSGIYDINGNQIDLLSGSDYDKTVKGIAHRGLSAIAPENTLSAYRLAKEKGFFFVECDISFTSDDVPVLLHDTTVDRTSNGTGNIYDLTLQQAKALDFGSWKSSAYAGTTIPTFEEFIRLCRDIQLHPYIELKNYCTTARIQGLVSTVKAHGMLDKVTWIGSVTSNLSDVKTNDANARLGIVTSDVSTAISTAQTLKTDANDVFIDSSVYTAAACEAAMNAGFSLEMWATDSESAIIGMNPYVSGIASNSLHAGKVLYDANIST